MRVLLTLTTALVVMLASLPAGACTIIAVGKGASADGSIAALPIATIFSSGRSGISPIRRAAARPGSQQPDQRPHLAAGRIGQGEDHRLGEAEDAEGVADLVHRRQRREVAEPAIAGGVAQ